MSSHTLPLVYNAYISSDQANELKDLLTFEMQSRTIMEIKVNYSQFKYSFEALENPKNTHTYFLLKAMEKEFKLKPLIRREESI